ncbi:MAG: alpha/beta hydrolase [Alphaproteobacteria bacterium]|nr:alpha/beta hydrolase [Alphaproteobacteria bacterium]
MPSPGLPAWASVLLALAAGLAALYGIVIASLFLLQRQILFRPAQDRPDFARVEVAGLEEVALPTADGLRLLAWFLPPRGEGPVLLFLHGNGGHIGHRTERIRRFAAQGWGVLLVEYRGYGGTPGTPSEAGLRLDAAAGLAALRARGIADGRIVLWGESLGSGLATWLAAREPVGAVVLETPYTSITAVAKRRYPFAPVDALLRDRFDSLVHMPAIRSPVLVLVAGRDVIVPPDMGHAIHAAAPDGELWVAEQGGHTDLMQHGAIEAVAGFLRRRLPAMPTADGLPRPAGVATTVP